MIKLYLNKNVLSKLILAGIFFSLIGINCLKDNWILTQINGMLCLTIAAISLLTGIAFLFDRKVVVFVSQDEIFDRRIMKRAISTDEIESMNIVTKRNHKFIKVTAKDTFEKKMFKPLFRFTSLFRKSNTKSIFIELDLLKGEKENIGNFMFG